MIFRFQYAFFIDGTSRESIEVDIINSVQGQSPDDSPITFDDALNFFHNPTHKEWILVYDNVDDASLRISDYLPKCRHGSVIITTRNQFLGQIASNKDSHIKLGPMSDEEAIESIYKSAELEKSELNQSAVSSIAAELGNLPVALIQAGSYILRTMCTPEEYLRRLRVNKAELMRKSTGDREDQSAYAAFELSYQRLPLSARNFLHILSHLHYNDFPLGIITQAAVHDFRLQLFAFSEEIEQFESSIQLLRDTFLTLKGSIEFILDSIVTALQNYSLATFHRSSIGLLLRIHPLNHLWAQESQPRPMQSTYKTAAVRLIVSSSPSKQFQVYLIPHIIFLLQKHRKEGFSLNDLGVFGTILMRTQRIENAQAVWQEICQILIFRGGIPGTFEGFNIIREGGTLSLPFVSVQAETWEPNLGRFDTLKALENYATTYHLKGSYEVAERLRDHVVFHLTNQLGEGDEETLKAKGELALTYQMQQKYSKAKALQTEILRELQSLLGEEHSDTLGVMVNLAITDRSLGNYVDAQELQEKILEKKKLQFGEDHWETLKAMINLAKTLLVQGKYILASQLQEMVRNTRTENLGEAHLKTLEATAHLAMTHRSLGNYSAAETAQAYVLEQRKLQLGQSHPSTLEAMEQLGLTYHSQGRYPISKRMQKEILEDRSKDLGEGHSDTIRAMVNLAITCRSEENYSEALSIQETVQQMRINLLGKAHPETLEATANLAITYYQMGRYSKACNLQKMVLSERPVNHPDRLNGMLDLAETYRCMDKFESALELQNLVVEARTRQLGENHLDTLEAASCLAQTYRSLGKYTMCETLQNRVLAERSRQLGKDHPNTQRLKVSLAKTYGSMGRYDAAERLLRDVIDSRVVDLGMNHLDSVASVDTLRELYEDKGDLIKALELVINMVVALEKEKSSLIQLWDRKLMRLETKIMWLGQRLPDHIQDKVSFSDEPYVKFTWDRS
jgi:tetratricopeptide (TPR) repeat protein